MSSTKTTTIICPVSIPVRQQQQKQQTVQHNAWNTKIISDDDTNNNCNFNTDGVLLDRNVNMNSYHSLSHIMDETLAIQLQDEQDGIDLNVDFGQQCQSEDKTTTTVPITTVSATSSTAVSSQVTVVSVLPAAEVSEKNDADFAYALKLQADELLAYNLRKSNTGSFNASSHVRVQYREDPLQAQLVDLALCSGAATKASRRHQSTVEEEKEFLLEGKYDKKFTRENSTRETKKGIRQHGRVEKATFSSKEGVLDTKTRLILHKLTNRGDLDQVFGVVRTGKEANVYSAIASSFVKSAEDDDNVTNKEVSHVAIKIYKTTLTAFRNRSEYITDELTAEFSSKSSLRQTYAWTRKEFSNLGAAHRAGLNVPYPICFKDHVLLMTFIGNENQGSAPQLRDANLTISQAKRAYAQVVKGTRQLYQEAKLVHADLSPYNLLYFRKKVFWIDFGQSVTTRHSNHLEYLTRDISNVTVFFNRLIEQENKDAATDAKDVDVPFMLSTELFFNYVVCEEKMEDMMSKLPHHLVEMMEPIVYKTSTKKTQNEKKPKTNDA